MRSFDPSPDDQIALFGEDFVFQAHPGARRMVYAQEGTRATLFKIRDSRNGDFALKVFKESFRDPQQHTVAERLARYKAIAGLQAADRRVVLPGDAGLPPALELSVVMPWIQGITWFDALQRARRGEHLCPEAAIHLCRRFLAVLQSLEERGLAHTDVAAGNVVIDLASLTVQLIDLEELFGPSFVAPPKVTGRTPGYTRKDLGVPTAGFWTAAADRFAGAVLAAEILVLSSPTLAPTSNGDSFFEPDSIGQPDAPRFRAAVEYLRQLSPSFAQLFEQAWTAPTLADCPPIAEYARPIEVLAGQTRPPSGDPFRRALRAPSVTAAPAATLSGPVGGWTPILDRARQPRRAAGSDRNPVVQPSMAPAPAPVPSRPPRRTPYALIAFVIALALGLLALSLATAGHL
jgi:hypothetical protein